MNLMKHLKDGFGSSGNCHFWKRGDRVFWENGEITDLNDGDVFTVYYHGRDNGEDYSQWSEEKRLSVKEEFSRIREEEKERERREIEDRKKLCEIARLKLTEEEYQAVYESAYIDCRGFY